ncbi:hypothetical protein [Crocinitomix catalasitica]|uniref:hypothetical protein n=1 Tax=Crocinitomix catalasitica TaxID=184607 RepID=UPI00047F782B|nr:hypothetical protein [Crocinitomix catalasitica]
MLGRLIKRKLNSNTLANVFVNAIIEATDQGYEEVTQLILTDAAFITEPTIKPGSNDQFLFIVLVGNLRFLDQHFNPVEAKEIRQHIIQKFANIYEMNEYDFEKMIGELDQFVSRVNHPSKNTLYGMSKAVFHKFNLNDHQEDYFKSLTTPNPLFLKRMDEILNNFIWDWDVFFKKYRLNID